MAKQVLRACHVCVCVCVCVCVLTVPSRSSEVVKLDTNTTLSVGYFSRVALSSWTNTWTYTQHTHAWTHTRMDTHTHTHTGHTWNPPGWQQSLLGEPSTSATHQTRAQTRRHIHTCRPTHTHTHTHTHSHTHTHTHAHTLPECCGSHLLGTYGDGPHDCITLSDPSKPVITSCWAVSVAVCCVGFVDPCCCVAAAAALPERRMTCRAVRGVATDFDSIW